VSSNNGTPLDGMAVEIGGMSLKVGGSSRSDEEEEDDENAGLRGWGESDEKRWCSLLVTNGTPSAVIGEVKDGKEASGMLVSAGRGVSLVEEEEENELYGLVESNEGVGSSVASDDKGSKGTIGAWVSRRGKRLDGGGALDIDDDEPRVWESTGSGT